MGGCWGIMRGMANPVGRPTKYTEELQAEADRYVYEWAEYDVVPSRVGLCCFLGISKQTSFEWAKHYPYFLATLQNIDALQEREAVNNGISGKFNSTITKLVLANHGYSDKVEQALTSPDGSMTPKQTINTVDPKEAAAQYQKIIEGDG